jgi:hypothetical protein
MLSHGPSLLLDSTLLDWGRKLCVGCFSLYTDCKSLSKLKSLLDTAGPQEASGCQAACLSPSSGSQGPTPAKLGSPSMWLKSTPGWAPPGPHSTESPQSTCQLAQNPPGREDEKAVTSSPELCRALFFSQVYWGLVVFLHFYLKSGFLFSF